MFGLRRREPVARLDFIVAGAQKSGTTALNYYLRRHRQIALPVEKELHFFDKDELFERAGEVSYDPLHRMFRRARPGSIAGENTPLYLYWRPALARIREYNAAMKLIIILRNPIDRAFSHWNMQSVRGVEPLDFLDAVRAEPLRIAESVPNQLRRLSYIDRSCYGEQLGRALRIFPREQFLIIKYEDFRARQRDWVEAVFAFLGLRPPFFRRVKAHDIPYRRAIRMDERKTVFEILREDIARVESMLRWDCSDWR